jgi:hypothetical protein
MKAKDYSGTIIGMLLIKEKLPCTPPTYTSRYKCTCSCNKEIIRTSDSLQRAKREKQLASCGCITGKSNKGNTNNTNALSHIGEVYGRLTIVGIEPKLYNKGQRGYKMICECICGKTTSQMYSDLKSGKVVSCGCWAREQNSISGMAVGIHNGRKACGKLRWYYIKSGEKIKMRSGYEVMYANILDKRGVKWQYEPLCHKLQEGSRYTPDFYIVDENKWIEVKGQITEKQIEKYELFRKLGNTLDIVYLEEIEKELSYRYTKFKKDWVTSHHTAGVITD